MVHGGFRGSRSCRSGIQIISRNTSLTLSESWRPWRTYRVSPWPSSQWFIRGAKTRTTLKLEDLPQGMLADLVKVEDEATPAYPTVVQQALNNMRKFESCVVLTRVGGFYELYFEHAEKFAPLLNIKLAEKKTSAGAVPMAGFPFFQLDRYLKILIQDLNQYVAISEEFANDAEAKAKSGGLLFDRKVTRIVTPGTLVDEKFMDPYANNFLLALHVAEAGSSGSSKPLSTDKHPAAESKAAELADRKVGLAWVDLSTGEFFMQRTSMAALPSAIVRIGAREIVMKEAADQAEIKAILDTVGNEGHIATSQLRSSTMATISDWDSMLESAVPAEAQGQFSMVEVSAGSVLLEYVKDKFQGHGMKLQPPIQRTEVESMGIGKETMRGLEILETLRDATPGGKGSLLHTIRRTVTKGGTRLLRDRISNPSTSLRVINQRLDLVQLFLEDSGLRERITDLLKRTFDSQRLVQKFSLGRGDADDLVSLHRTITATRNIQETLESSIVQNAENARPPKIESSLLQLIERLSMDGPSQLASRIAEAIDEDGLLANHISTESETAAIMGLAQEVIDAEGNAGDIEAMPRAISSKSIARAAKENETEEQSTAWIMRRDATPVLQRLHDHLIHLHEDKYRLIARLRGETGAVSMTLRWTPGLGHHCHVKGVKDVKASMETLGSNKNASTSKSTRSFYLSEWSKLGARIDQLKLQITAEEQVVFRELRDNVVRNLVRLRRNASVLDELDVACSLAVLAQEQNLVRPLLNEGMAHKIIAGRHPTVRVGLEEQGRSFVSNNCFVGNKERIWLITGPNMAGKSTFLRQNALISILAQIGSFVHAEYAEIGIVDQMFSRIGSADDLYRDQSTFMVEMLEAANILKHATPRSFVIMDEIGRGTTPEDGIAVAYACLHHLYYINNCRTLFATHFHKLADMTADWEQLGRYCTDIAELNDGAFTYVHRLKQGVNRESHALKVASLAGIPKTAIDVASQVLTR